MRELRSSSWVTYFEMLAAAGAAPLVSVEVIAGEPDDRHDGRRGLRSIGYDPIASQLSLALGPRSGGDVVALRHFISKPKTITVDGQEPLRPSAIRVQDSSGVETRIRFQYGQTVSRRGFSAA